MKELVKVSVQTIGDEEVNAVDARDLYVFLEIKKQFTDWIRPKIKDYGFVINSDFYPSKSIALNGREMETYIVSIDMAKELSMLSMTAKGKEARKYFIAMEKKAIKLLEEKRNAPEVEPWVLRSNSVAAFLTSFDAPKHLVVIECAKHVVQIGGPDLSASLKQLPCMDNLDDKDLYLEPTELGKHFGLTAVKMNRQLQDWGLQDRINGEWVLTKLGADIASNHAWKVQNKSGYNFKWNFDAIKIIESDLQERLAV